jgi:LysR family transcriptional regulator, glycine cleavage system transcriptional activator
VNQLPPLNALRAFEVAARTGSFVQAGAELGVSSAAISQQVKLLESYLDKKMFHRQGNRITLTDAGRTIYPRLEQAFGDIADLTASISERQARAQIVISVLPTMAELWLLPRLAGFAHLGAVEIRLAEDPVNFVADGIDLRVTYDATPYPDYRVVPLFCDRIVPVCAPKFLADLSGGQDTRIDEMPDSAFIHTDWGSDYASQPSWSAWMAAARFSRFLDPAKGLQLRQTSLVVTAARHGLGVALVPERIAGLLISDGSLIRLHDLALPMRSEYVLVSPNALARKEPLQNLIQHLLAGSG